MTAASPGRHALGSGGSKGGWTPLGAGRVVREGGA